MRGERATATGAGDGRGRAPKRVLEHRNGERSAGPAGPTAMRYIAGRIDEVRVYDTALNPSEIESDTNTPIGSDP
jgi:hypothetical protein